MLLSWLKRQVLNDQILCVISSGWWMDPMVSVVGLLSDLWSRHTGSNPRLHQPPST